jgi:hypothetical protein
LSVEAKTEALKRLGVVMVECPTCKEQFNASRTPRYWNNWVLEDNIGWCPAAISCSQKCGDDYSKVMESASTTPGYSFYCEEEV